MAKNANEQGTEQGTSSPASTAGSESLQGQQGGRQAGGLQGTEAHPAGGPQSGAMQRRAGQGAAIHSRNPFAMMQQLSDEMDRLFDSVLYGMPTRRSTRGLDMPSVWAPDVEMSTEGNRLRVCVDLPGVSRENVKVDVKEGMLTIEGERREERSEGSEQQGYKRSERRYGSFYRSIALPEGVDTEQAQARMKDGVLEITLPVAEHAKGRRIDIQG